MLLNCILFIKCIHLESPASNQINNIIITEDHPKCMILFNQFLRKQNYTVIAFCVSVFSHALNFPHKSYQKWLFSHSKPWSSTYMGNSRDIFTNKRNYSQKRMMRGKKNATLWRQTFCCRFFFMEIRLYRLKLYLVYTCIDSLPE